MRNKADSKFLNKLVSDCITYRLHEIEALEYIEKEFGKPLSKRAYWDRRSKLQSPSASKAWLNWFTRIGFVELRQKQIDDVITILEDSFQTLHRLTHETDIFGKKIRRDENLILKIKDSIMESEELLAELGLGTPIVAAIKKKIDNAYSLQNGNDNNGDNNYPIKFTR